MNNKTTTIYDMIDQMDPETLKTILKRIVSEFRIIEYQLTKMLKGE